MSQDEKAVGTRVLVSRYQIERPLGQGGMGAVYLARDRNLADRLCAIKELHDQSIADDQAESVRRFTTEAEALAKVNHPGIPQVYDRFEANGRYYVVMEYVAGEDLGAWLRRHLKEEKTPPAEVEVIDLSVQVCDILTYLHSQQPALIHRDVKPGNLVRTTGGLIKLVDFGIAKVASSRGTVVGTHGYAPPEQYRGESEPRSDLFALGATLHYFLSGRDPQKQAPFDFTPLSRLNRQVTPAMANLVAQLLGLNPDERPASAEVVKAKLLAVRAAHVPNERQQSTGGAATEVETDEGICPLCGADPIAGLRFCQRCGARLGRHLPVLHLREHSDDLGLRLPEHLFTAGRFEWVTGVDGDGAVSVLMLLGVVDSGPMGNIAFVIRRPARFTAGSSIVGLPVEAYCCDPDGSDWQMQPVHLDQRQVVACARQIWGGLTVRTEGSPID